MDFTGLLFFHFGKQKVALYSQAILSINNFWTLLNTKFLFDCTREQVGLHFGARQHG